MNTQNNIVDFQRAKEVLNGLKEYINNKNRSINVQNEMQLAEQNPIATDKIEETPLPAIDLNTSLSSSESIEPKVSETEETISLVEPALAMNQLNQPSTTIPETYMESSSSELQKEANGMQTNLTSAVPPTSSNNIENSSQEIIPESASMGLQQADNFQGMVAQPQNILSSSNNENDSQVISFPTSTTIVQDDVSSSFSEIPQEETNLPASADMSLNNSLSSENSEVLSSSNNLETVPQIDINSVMGESAKVGDTNINQNNTGVYKAATNMGAVTINDTSSIKTSGEVTIPTGQEAVPQPSSPIVTEASFNETPETMKIAA